MSFNRHDLETLMCYLVRQPEVVKIAAPMLDIDFFDDTSERAYKLLWSIVLSFWKEYNKIVSKGFLLAEIAKRTENSIEFPDAELVRPAYVIVETSYDTLSEDDLIPDYGFKLLEEFLFDRKIVQKLAFDAEDGNISRNVLREYSKTAETISIQRVQPIYPFAGESQLDPVTPRQPTGVTFMDVMMNGGVRSGEFYGLFAPTGGGKTALTIQLATEYARQGKRFGIFVYEESAETPDYRARIYACAARMNLEMIEKTIKNGPDDLSEKDRRNYDRARQEIDKNLLLFDMSGNGEVKAGFGGVAEIRSIVERMEQCGEKLDGIAIDWLLPMLQRRFAIDENNRSSDERKYSQVIADEIKQLAQGTGTWVLLCNQIAAAKSKAKKVHHSDAAEDKSTAWLMNGCFALGALSEESAIGNLAFSKSRGTATGGTIIQLVGNQSRFEALDEEKYEYDERIQDWLTKGSGTAVPGAENKVSDLLAGELEDA